MTNAKLADAILQFIVNGPEAVSYIHRNLQQEGWKGLGVLAEFEWTCEKLGFTVQQGINHRGQKRIEVSL